MSVLSQDTVDPVEQAAEDTDSNHHHERVTPAIEFREVDLAFDDQVVLDKVSFTVRRGETKIVLGGSGTGKSTIINIVLGLLKPDDGQVFVDGVDITDVDEADLTLIRENIGMVF